MNLIISILILIPLSFSLLACGSNSEKNIQLHQKQATSERPHLKINILDAAGGNEPVDRFDIKCESLNECPQFVGSLLSFTKTIKGHAINMCSFTLISPNRIMTNEHCLSAEVLKSKDCSNTYAVFPKTNNHKKLKIKCNKVIAHSKYNNFENSARPDWAILELSENALRSPITTNTNGVSHLSAVELYPTFYSKLNKNQGNKLNSTYEGVIKKVNCKTNMASKLMMIYNNPKAPLIALECLSELEKGNSGTGMVSNNQLVGVFSAKSASDENKFMGNTVTLNGKAIGGTNLHCIDELNNDFNESCDFDILDNNHLNFYHTFMFSNFLSEAQINELKKHINSDPSISWSPYDGSFNNKFSIIVDSDFLTDSLTSEYVKNYFYSTMYPNYPSCIHKSRINHNNFLLTLPYFKRDLTKSSLSEAAIYSTPMNMRKLGYQVNYNNKLKTFEASLIRMQDIKEYNNFIRLQIEFNLKFPKCQNSGQQVDCIPFISANNDINQFILNTDYDPYLFYNEDLIHSKDIDVNKSVKIPVCEN